MIYSRRHNRYSKWYTSKIPHGYRSSHAKKPNAMKNKVDWLISQLKIVGGAETFLLEIARACGSSTRTTGNC